MQARRISISIVLYKTDKAQLARCLDSIQRILPIPRVYVIDHSPDASLGAFFGSFSWVRYTHNAANPGFGAGHNLAIRQACEVRSDYHLVLNADVAFDYDVVTPMRDYMDKHTAVGLMMPKILYPNGAVQRLAKLVPNPFDLIIRRFMPKFLRHKFDYKFELRGLAEDKIVFAPYLSGCFMFIRTDIFHNIGVFDERFFMYPEDIDFTRRVAAHFDTLFFPHVSVFHEYGAASQRDLRMFVIHSWNIVKYFNKWGWFHDDERERLNDRTLAQFSGLWPAKPEV
jgi:GT2 family glycosyltransferase